MADTLRTLPDAPVATATSPAAESTPGTVNSGAAGASELEPVEILERDFKYMEVPMHALPRARIDLDKGRASADRPRAGQGLRLLRGRMILYVHVHVRAAMSMSMSGRMIPLR